MGRRLLTPGCGFPREPEVSSRPFRPNAAQYRWFHPIPFSPRGRDFTTSCAGSSQTPLSTTAGNLPPAAAPPPRYAILGLDLRYDIVDVRQSQFDVAERHPVCAGAEPATI